MGTGQTKPQQKTGSSEHHRMSDYKIVQDVNDKDRKLMEVNCPVSGQAEITYWQSQLRHISAISKHSNSAHFLPLRYHLVQEGMCGTSGILKMQFDYYPYILSEEIQSRVKLNTPFNEQQLWYLLFQIVCASKDYQKLNMKSGDIRPRNIVINEHGQIRVVTRCSFPNQQPNYVKAFESKEPGYLSPEQLSDIEKRMVSPMSDPVLSETFSIGMTILDAALLFDSETLYDMYYIGFKAHIFNENVYKWKTSSYSPFLIKTVENMVEVNHIERPTPGEVYAILLPYQQQIRNLEPFIPDKEKSRDSLENYQKSMRSRTVINAQRSIKPLGNRPPIDILSNNGHLKQNGTPKSTVQPIKFPQMISSEQRRNEQLSQTQNLQKMMKVVPNSTGYPYLHQHEVYAPQHKRTFNHVEKSRP